MNVSPIAGLRVLVVEDEMLVAMLIEEALIDLGCEIVGPFGTVGDALCAAKGERISLAVLDVNLRGERVYPVAEVLATRGIPFVLLSGYGQDAIPAGRPNWRAFPKPFHTHDLTRMLEGMYRA